MTTIRTDAESPTRGHFKRWRVAETDPEADAFARSLRVEPLVAQLLLGRGVRDAEAGRRFLSPTLMDLYDPSRLPGAARAAERIVQALRNGERVVIYGDYDVDGITATAILYHTLTTAAPDAEIVRYVPHRIDEGYGINSEALASLAEDGASVVVSVDCGIQAHEPAERARELGLDLIITDHHHFTDAADLPPAHTLVHPRLPGGDGEPYPFGELCGAGVAYKLAWQIARTWCGTERVSAVFKELLVNMLPLAALGTVADVVPLIDENRTLAMFGLRRIKKTPLVGLNALIDSARLRDEKIDSYHVGFVLGPRLNACGRMGHAKEAVTLLTDPEPDEAREIAETLNKTNEQRRATERKILEQASEMVRERGDDADAVRAIVLGDERWHPGVVGIVCSRLVERFGRPTILLCTDNGEAAGSARSIDGFHMHEALTACSEHLEGFGGHAMAAGMRLRTENLDAFREAMVAHAAEELGVEDLTPLLEIDAEASLSQLSYQTVDQLQWLAPFGRSNPSPLLLIRGARLTQPPRTMGREARHLSLFAEQDGRTLRCVGWNMGDLAENLHAGEEIDLVAEPGVNHFNGRTTVELTIRDLRWGRPQV